MRKITCLLLIALLGVSLSSFAQEEPEAPSPQDSAVIANFSKALVKFVHRKAKEEGGYFKVFDDTTQQMLDLTLVRVHEGKLCNLKDNIWFACADFKATNGNLYDIDIFMKKEPDGKFVDDQKPTVHKVNGVPRYIWVEDEQGVWQRSPVNKPVDVMKSN